MKLTVVIPTKGGYYREKSLTYTLQSYLHQDRYNCDLEILVVIDGKNCEDTERVEDIVERFKVCSSLKIESIVYYGSNPVWGGIEYLFKNTDYVLIQGDDELAARTKIRVLERIMEEFRDCVLQLPVFERTTEPRFMPKNMIGQVNKYGITSNFDALPEDYSEPFEIRNLASNRVMPIDVASKYNLENVYLWRGYGVETFLAFLLNRDRVKMYYVPRIEVANLHLQAGRSFWTGQLNEANYFASRKELERMIFEVSLDFHAVESEILRKALSRLANFTYIAWMFNDVELIHRILRNLIEGRGYFTRLNSKQRFKLLQKAKEVIAREYNIFKLKEIFKHYEITLGTFHSP